jgi:hypothetical protein
MEVMMELGILERVTLLNILPAEGDVVSLRIIRKLRENLGFTEEEIKTYEIKTADGQIMWKENGYKIDIPIGEKATDIIKDAFNKLNREKKLREEMLPVYDLFFPENG